MSYLALAIGCSMLVGGLVLIVFGGRARRDPQGRGTARIAIGIVLTVLACAAGLLWLLSELGPVYPA